jgi:iron complex transport system substrate-binding protein
MKQLIYFLAITIFSVSCHSASNTKHQKNDAKGRKMELRYAKGFSVEYHDNFTLVTVKNPWDTAHILANYVLVDRNKTLPKTLPQGTVVKIPVNSVAICTSVHAGMWQQLNQLDKITGVCEPEYIRIPSVSNRIENHQIENLGLASAINIEKLMSLNPDILIVSPFETGEQMAFSKIKIPVIKDASYMENTPLGRAEWLKFEALFTNSLSKADSIFDAIEQRYNHLKSLTNKVQSRPTVFTEKKYGDSWFTAGGKSFIANFINDAGGEYLWKDLNQTGSAPLSFESVFAKAVNADFWLIKYNAPQTDMNYAALQSEFELYAGFKAFKNHNIYAVNSAKTPFYEVGPLEPDVVLADMVSIFHPELLPGYKPKYYFNLKAE